MNVVKSVNTLARFGRKVAPTACAIGAAAGVVATGVLAARAGRQDAMNDIRAGDEPKNARIKRKIKTYSKPVIAGVITIGAIVLCDRLHVKRYAAMAGAAGLIQSNYDSLQNAVKTTVSEEDSKKIFDKKADVEANAIYEQCKRNGIEPIDTHTGDILWYEPESRRWFLASIDHVKDAAYHTNRNFKLRGSSPFNEWLSFLNLPDDDPEFNTLGWYEREGEIYYGYTWIDFLWEDKELRDGTKYKLLVYPFGPHLTEK